MHLARVLVFVVLLGAVLGMPAWAADSPKGKVVVIEAPTPVYSKPLNRDGLVYRVGEQVGTLDPGTRAIVESDLTVRTVLGEQVWLRVSARPGEKIPTGWISAKSVRANGGKGK
jgi:hypothetical protein